MKVAWIFLLAPVLALCLSLPVHAEQDQEGDLVVTFAGGMRPSSLPRHQLAPVAVRVAGDVRTANGSTGQIPQLRLISVAINREGRLFDRGLPVCRVKEIQPATEAAARRLCGEAIVGSGHVTLTIDIPSQVPFALRAHLLAFNGPRSGGEKLILAQIYARDPPGAFILPFHVLRRPGLFGTVLRTSLPASAQRWAYLTHFDMTLHRTYTYGGRRRGYISAACPAPAGFDSVLFPFARATYGFASGQRLTIPIARVCHVSG